MSYMMEKMKLSVITGLVDGISIQFSGEYTTIEQVYHNFLQKQWVYTTSVSQITQFIHLIYSEFSLLSLNYIIEDLWETDHHNRLSLRRIIKNCMPLFNAFNLKIRYKAIFKSKR